MNDVFTQMKWGKDGLIPVITQEYKTGKVLMLAWMNQEALCTTIKEKQAVYFSRSRQKLWRKGEQSGNIQELKEIRTDCDNDVILMQVKQIGGITCHTGRSRCFYKRYENGMWNLVQSE